MMKIKIITQNDTEIALVDSDQILLTDVQSALDLMVTVQYETGSNNIIINKGAICEEFFDLKTKLAGDVLQKFVNYRVRIAIVGDYSAYTSKSLKDFIYECNKGNSVFFVENESQAIEKLAKCTNL